MMRPIAVMMGAQALISMNLNLVLSAYTRRQYVSCHEALQHNLHNVFSTAVRQGAGGVGGGAAGSGRRR
jgi:hypothetical protein